MNLAQRLVLTIGSVLLLVAILFPPWVYTCKYPELAGVERAAGYHLIFGQHTPQDPTALARLFSLGEGNNVQLEFFNVRIDQTRLTFQIIGILLLTTILYFLLRSPAPSIRNGKG